MYNPTNTYYIKAGSHSPNATFFAFILFKRGIIDKDVKINQFSVKNRQSNTKKSYQHRVSAALLRWIKMGLFGIDHLLGHSSIDRNTLAVNEVTLLVAQEEAGAGNILGTTHTAREVKLVVFGA